MSEQFGLNVSRRFEWRNVPGYIGTQVVAGLAAGGLVTLVASGKDGFVVTGNLAANVIGGPRFQELLPLRGGEAGPRGRRRIGTVPTTPGLGVSLRR